MSEMYDVTAFLRRFGDNSELVTDLIQLLEIWQQIDEHGFGNQPLQERANAQAQMMRSKYGLTSEDLVIIFDHEDAFQAHLRHPSRPAR